MASILSGADRTIQTSIQHREALFLIPQKLIKEAVETKNYNQLKAFNRINALTTCKSAEHGWLGASYSCMEILTVFTLILKIKNVILSKGHAASGQYAVLYGLDKLSENDLKNYKNGAKGLEAHADLMMDTGSLGQCLSTVAGMAIVNTDETYVVILGDGEMQEGQNYEALMTIKKYFLSNIIPIIDLNDFQSDNLCDEIMPIHNLEMVIRGFGFHVLHVDGHNEHELLNAYDIAKNREKLCVIFAKTVKAGGTVFMESSKHSVTKMECLPWHTKVPNWLLYRNIINEQLNKSESVEAIELFKTHCSKYLNDDDSIISLKNTHRPVYKSNEIGTGKAFGFYLTECVNNPQNEYHKQLAIVDADLATSCGINGAVNNKMYFELGVAEQDAISFAAGLALSGKVIPVVNTYSNFLKRGFENMFISIIEGATIIFAGHYSGLCYHTDGKSHQSIDDLSVFSALHPRLLVMDPPCPLLAKRMLEKVIQSRQPAYFRLRRTYVPVLFDFIDKSLRSRNGTTWQDIFSPILLRPKRDNGVQNNAVSLENIQRSDPNYKSWSNVAFVTIGTVASDLAVKCCRQSPFFKGSQILVVTTLNDTTNDLDEHIWLNFFTQKSLKYVIVVEDDVGALYKHVCLNYAMLQGKSYLGAALPCLQFLSKKIVESGPSQRTLDSCLRHFGFTVNAIEDLYKKILLKTS
eukprot:g7487.t1